MEISNLCFNFANRTLRWHYGASINVSTNLTGMKDRIKTVMESNHMTQKIFSQFTGISEGSLSGVLNNKTRPTLQMVDAIHKHFPQVSLEWLMYGTGSMELTASDADTSGDAPAAAAGQGIQSSLGGVGQGTAARQSAPYAQADVSPRLFDPQQPSADPRYQTDHSGVVQTQIKIVDKPQRRITEIRIFYDDQTWETFTPKK